MSNPENPPAFPHSPFVECDGRVMSYGEIGMTLRDYFAAAAMQGLIGTVKKDSDVIDLAKAAYLVADEMLKERAKTP